jgi:hypothetical protein
MLLCLNHRFGQSKIETRLNNPIKKCDIRQINLGLGWAWSKVGSDIFCQKSK